MDKTFAFTVNGQARTVTTDPERPLLQVLREELQLTGSKYGCGEGQCHACTVLINGKSTPSCITPVRNADGQSIQTIEGLAQGERLHPVQEAFLAEGAFQCGYCTPGMILGVVELLAQTPKPTDTEIRSRLQGHLCRCCNYPKLIKAIHRAAGQTQGANAGPQSITNPTAEGRVSKVEGRRAALASLASRPPALASGNLRAGT
jgi:aerobic-type carbon monoxide dehydrogenase small subunit (CoxS/CutS family)